MIKFTQEMTFAIGDRSVTFTGRDPFPVDDPVLKKGLLAIGVFTEQENGDLVYSGKVTVPMKDGTTREIDPRGFLAVDKNDIAHPGTKVLR